jgi:hypothetical protein
LEVGTIAVRALGGPINEVMPYVHVTIPQLQFRKHYVADEVTVIFRFEFILKTKFIVSLGTLSLLNGPGIAAEGALRKLSVPLQPYLGMVHKEVTYTCH